MKPFAKLSRPLILWSAGEILSPKQLLCRPWTPCLWPIADRFLIRNRKSSIFLIPEQREEMNVNLDLSCH